MAHDVLWGASFLADRAPQVCRSLRGWYSRCACDCKAGNALYSAKVLDKKICGAIAIRLEAIVSRLQP